MLVTSNWGIALPATTVILFCASATPAERQQRNSPITTCEVRLLMGIPLVTILIFIFMIFVLLFLKMLLFEGNGIRILAKTVCFCVSYSARREAGFINDVLE